MAPISFHEDLAPVCTPIGHEMGPNDGSRADFPSRDPESWLCLLTNSSNVNIISEGDNTQTIVLVSLTLSSGSPRRIAHGISGSPLYLAKMLRRLRHT